MLDYMMIVITIAVVVFSAAILYHKRTKVKNVHGIKGWVSPVCMVLTPVFMLFAHLFDVVGIISWAVFFVLLLVAAYFTKFMPVPKESH
ncbi:hypothetical protein [Halalkalibacter okhensis]|uniref:Uncharacterized protein n=1 Tax=Halalkalibacter okhensis TaxID=333138 RepID=A0A0B0IAU2_9BACI|nr:hypothetical protein [Halalkalibacter okhensis]KHF38360.1 hypothetical protein LQ50_21780 [Halalkalibacter okhensis]